MDYSRVTVTGVRSVGVGCRVIPVSKKFITIHLRRWMGRDGGGYQFNGNGNLICRHGGCHCVKELSTALSHEVIHLIMFKWFGYRTTLKLDKIASPWYRGAAPL